MAALDPRDISELQKAVNDASLRTTALWVSFMTFAAYLIVATGSVSHLKLFQETAIKLPILAAELPLVAFFAIAPFFLILFHFYLFLNLVTLARRISTYNRVLAQNVKAEADRDLLRARLDTFLVVQLLSRPPQLLSRSPKKRSGLYARLLTIVVWITLVGVPILLLLQFQLTFLPYHLSVVTWIHRSFIIVDLTLIWFFWFAIYHRGELHFPRLSRHLIALAGSVAAILISIIVVAYPGERVTQLAKVKLPLVCPDRLVPISDCFLRGPINMVTGQPERYFFNVLVLPFQILTDVRKIDASQKTVSLRGRDLAGAILIKSHLRLVDFTGTNLDGARLDEADASGAFFGCEDTGAPIPENPVWPDHGCSSLRGASLRRANLSGASFIGARMEGSVLIEANLSGARLENVHLEATVLTSANLTAAYLRSARLQNAYLYQTNLSGAMLDRSELSGALLEQSKFEFASVGQFNRVSVGNTVGQPVLDFAAFDLDGSPGSLPNDVSDFNEMRTRMLNRLLEEEKRRNPWKQYALADEVNPLFFVFIPAFYENFYRKAGTDWHLLRMNVNAKWNSVNKAKKKDIESIKRRFLAERFAELACKDENSPFVARGLISSEIILRAGASADIFLNKIRDIPNCRGAAELKAHDYGAVEIIRAGGSVMDKADIYPPTTSTAAASANMKLGKR